MGLKRNMIKTGIISFKTINAGTHAALKSQLLLSRETCSEQVTEYHHAKQNSV